MKKIICITVAVIMLMSVTVSASAAEYYGYQQEVGSGEIEVTSHVYSHFVITVPETISTDNPNDGMVRVSEVSLEDGYFIKIGVNNLNENNKIVMTNVTNPDINAEMSINGNYSYDSVYNTDRNAIMMFTNYDFKDSNSAEAGIACQLDSNAPAGVYQGKITYTITCEPQH